MAHLFTAYMNTLISYESKHIHQSELNYLNPVKLLLGDCEPGKHRAEQPLLAEMSIRHEPLNAAFYSL